MKVYPLPLGWFVNQLSNNEHFTFAKYGDGEWRTILGGKYMYGHNKNGCTFTPELSAELRHVLRFAKYEHGRQGMLRIARRTLGGEIGKYLKGNGIAYRWYDGDVLLNNALNGNLLPFIEALRKRRVLVVGQPSLRNLGIVGFFRPVTFYHPPAQNAVNDRIAIVNNINHIVDQYNIDVVLWSCGMHSKVFIHDIWKAKGGLVTQIDCGSMWDGFVGGNSNRSYIKKGRVRWQGLKDVYAGKRKKQPGETFRK